jgi:hypothetical protein
MAVLWERSWSNRSIVKTESFAATDHRNPNKGWIILVPSLWPSPTVIVSATRIKEEPHLWWVDRRLEMIA